MRSKEKYEFSRRELEEIQLLDLAIKGNDQAVVTIMQAIIKMPPYYERDGFYILSTGAGGKFAAVKDFFLIGLKTACDRKSSFQVATFPAHYAVRSLYNRETIKGHMYPKIARVFDKLEVCRKLNTGEYDFDSFFTIISSIMVQGEYNENRRGWSWW